MIPRENSLEMNSQYSNYKADTQRREGMTSEILTLRGGKGVVVRWKRKDTVEMLDGGQNKSNGEHIHHHGYNSAQPCSVNSKTQCQRRPNVSRAIRSTYTGKSIESKKKVIRMLFVLVAEFFITWTPIHFVVRNNYCRNLQSGKIKTNNKVTSFKLCAFKNLFS